MFDLKIERLRLNIGNAAGHEHRVRPIALRAVALLAERLDGIKISRARWDSVSAQPVDLHLNVMSNEQAASGIATAWANALTGEISREQD
jgi:hypothetical protein